MTIWNALAAGGALWCLGWTAMAFATLPAVQGQARMRKVWGATALCVAFGLCLWAAIP